MQELTKYRKTIVAIVGAALTWGVANFADNQNISQWLSLVTAILTAAGVYQAKNEE
jgi:hypothetical protein